MTTADSIHDAARARFDAGEFIPVVDLCRDGLDLNPDHAGLLQLSGLAHYRLGDLDRARDDLETASAVAVLSPMAQVALADVYVRFRQPAAARAMYEFLAEPGRCPTPLLPEVARGLGGLGADVTALEVCRRMIQLRPWSHQAYFGAAFYLKRLDAPAETILPLVRRAFDLAPDLMSYRVSLALLYARTDRHREAAEVIKPVAPESVSCANCVRRILALAEQADDHSLAESWRAWLHRVLQAPKETGE